MTQLCYSESLVYNLLVKYPNCSKRLQAQGEMASKKTCLKIYGLLQSSCFHVALFCAEDLEKNIPAKFDPPIVQPMLDCDWKHFILKKIKELREESWALTKEEVICFIGNHILGNEKDLLSWAQKEHKYEDFRPSILYDAIAEEAYKEYFIQNSRSIVFMEISIDAENAGKLVFELFDDICPKTCENFRSLCTGNKGRTKGGLTLHYLHTLFHRIVPNGWIQGGDIFHSRGDTGESIFGKFFDDENFVVTHDKRGILGMANQGKHTNGSQFYITLQPTPWMDAKYVAFGRLIEGSKLLDELEKVPTENERPSYDCRIQACGVYSPDI